MLASSALPLAATSAALPTVLPAEGTETAVSADFAALLAQGTLAPAALAEGLAMPPVAPAAANGTAPEPATPGNILPPSLPPVLPASANLGALPSAVTLPVESAAPTEPAEAVPMPRTAHAPAARPAAGRPERAVPYPDVPADGDGDQPDPLVNSTAETPDTPSPVSSNPAMMPGLTPVLLPAVPSREPSADAPRAWRASSPNGASSAAAPPGAVAPQAIAQASPRALPALVAAARSASLPRPADPAAEGAEARAGSVPAAPNLAVVPPMMRAGVRLDVTIAVPAPGARDAARMAAPADAFALMPDATATAPSPVATNAVLPPPQAWAAAALPGLPSAVVSAHDFAVVVDRLAAARESAGLQSVAISVPHADFGRVHLAFRQEDGGLAATLSSSDPDFARIAAQTAPPVLPVTEARTPDPASASTQGRGDTAPGAHTGSQTGRGHTAPDRRSNEDGRPGSPVRPGGPPQDGARRSGIFA